MAIYGNFVHFVGFTIRKQKDRPKWREPPSHRTTKILSPHGQAQIEILAKTKGHQIAHGSQSDLET